LVPIKQRDGYQFVFAGFGWIVRPVCHCRVEIIEFEKEPAAGERERAEIMFRVRIVRGVEV
jgi:hypothetical protein